MPTKFQDLPVKNITDEQAIKTDRRTLSSEQTILLVSHSLKNRTEQHKDSFVVRRTTTDWNHLSQ